MKFFQSIILFFKLILIIRTLDYPEAQFKCPTIQTISGHYSKITGFSYIPYSAFYASVDDTNKLLINDIRNGEVIFEQEGVLQDSEGVISVISSSKGDVLVLSKTEILVINIFKEDPLLQNTITTDQISINTGIPSGPGKSNQPSNFAIAQSVIGINGNANPIHLLLGISQTNLLYVSSIPNIVDKQTSTDGGVWNPTNLDYTISAFGHLSGSSIIAVQYGASLKIPPVNTYENCLVFLDLKKLTLDTSSTVFNAAQMLSNVVQYINLGATPITLIYNFIYLDEYYISFVMQSKVLIIYQVQDFIASNYQLTSTAIKMTFTNSISSLQYIYIPNTARILIGFTNGNAISIDIANNISSHSTTAKTVTNITQYFLQNSIGFKQKISSTFFDSSSNTLSAISIITSKQGSLSFDYSQLNLVTNTVSNFQTLTFNNVGSAHNLIVKTNVIFTVIQKVSIYVAKNNSVCPSSPLATDYIGVNAYSYQLKDGQIITSGNLDLQSSNLIINDIVYSFSFIDNGENYVLLLITTTPFLFNDYCKQNVSGNNPPPNPPPQGQSSLQVIIINVSTNKIVFSANNPLITSDNPTGSLLEANIDSNKNIFLLFRSFIIFIKPYLDSNNVMKLFQQTYQQTDILNQIITQQANTTISIEQLSTFNYIPTLNKFILQVYINSSANNNVLITCIFSYDQAWTIDSKIKLLNVLIPSVNKNQSDSKLSEIIQLQYISDNSLLVCYFGDEIKTLLLDLTTWNLSLVMIITDTKTITEDSFVYTFKNQANFILKLDANSNIQIYSMNSCLTNNCINQVCQQNSTLKQGGSSTLSDIFNINDQLPRGELLDVQMGKILKMINTFSKTSMNLNILVEKGSTLFWKNRYVSLENYDLQYLKSNKLNLKISSIDSMLQNPESTSEIFYLVSSETLDLNVKIEKYIVAYPSNKQVTELNMKNIVIQNQNFLNIRSFITITRVGYIITLENFTIQESTFLNSNFIYSPSLLTLKISTFTFNNNIILNQDSSIYSSNYFITSQSTTLDNLSLDSNVFQDTIIFGLNSFPDSLFWSITKLNLNNSVFLITKNGINALIFDGQSTTVSTPPSTFEMKQSFVKKSSVLFCSYSQYQINKCASTQQTTATTTNNNTSLIYANVASYYQFALDYILEASIDDFQDIDNSFSFLVQSRAGTLNINKYTCSNTILSNLIIDNSCIYLKDHFQINLMISNSNFKNKNIQNGYIIQIYSDLYSAGLQEADGNIKLLHNTFENIVIQTLSSFYKSSTIYIYSLQKLIIKFNDDKFDGITLTSPQRLFYNQGSCLLIDTPFSSFDLENSSFINLHMFSPSASVYTNVNTIILNSCNFNNNNFGLTDSNFQGGFLEVSSNDLNVLSSNFTQGYSMKGVGVNIVPSQSKANYTFANCIFQNLISLTQGGAIYLGGALNQTTLTFKSCNFDNLASYQGGVLYTAYAVQSKDKSNFYSVYPIVTFIDCSTSNVFAFQGGFVYSENNNIILTKHTSTTNNPNIQSNLNVNVLRFINDLEEIGEFIYLQQSFLLASQLNVKDHSSFTKAQANSASNIVFINAISKSNATLIESSIDSCKFSTSGFVNIQSSTLKLVSTNITNIEFQQRSVRLLQTNINFEITSKFSTIIASSQSLVDFSNAYLQNINCQSEFCSGGALMIQNSEGKIEGSHFIQNTCYQNGGSISIINLSSPTVISNTYIIDSIAKNGNGGGLSFITDQNANDLKIENCFILNNSAQQGGGIYFEFQKEPQSSQYISSLINTKVSQNQANILGGGIYYQGYQPYIDPNSIITQNTAKSSFGQNSFSYPKKILLNYNLSKSQGLFSYNTYTNNKGETIYKLYNQVSGIALPNLIFQLVDENGAVLDKSYLKIAQESVSIKLNKENTLSQSQFAIASQIQEFSFNDYFNVTNMVLVGTPGTTVFLEITSDSIKATSAVQYRLLLEVEFRFCERGEVFQQYNDQSYNPSKVFYKCFKCQQGTYSIAYPDLINPVEECKKCSPYAFCPGGDILEVTPGYWRINDQTDNIIECINAPQNCLGGSSNSTCSTAHTGPLCESCDIEDNYSTTGNFQCGSCGDQVTNSMKIIGLMIFYIISAKISVDGVLERLLTMFSFQSVLSNKILEKTEQDTSILLKLILNYFQIIMVLTTFQISIPTTFNSPVEVIASPTTQILYSFECFFYSLSQQTGINMIYIQIITSLIIPIVCLILFFITGTISYRNDPFRKSFYLNTSFLYCFMYFQPSIFKNSISIITCRKIGEISYIQYNVLFECYTEEYDLWSVSLILPIISIVGFLIPLVIALIIFRSLKQSVLDRKKYVFMTGEYDPKFWYWEFIKIYMKLLIMCCLIFYEYDIPNKILFIFFIVALYGFLLFFIQPYSTKIYEKVDILQTGIQGASIYFAFVAYQNMNNIFWWLFAILIIAFINLIFIVWCVKLLTKAFIVQKQSTIEEIKLYLIKFLCCRKYFFSEGSRKHYIKKRWLRSVIKDMKKRKVINLWTGKLKVEKQQLFEILQGKLIVEEKDKIFSRRENKVKNLNSSQLQPEELQEQKNLQTSKFRDYEFQQNNPHHVDLQKNEQIGTFIREEGIQLSIFDKKVSMQKKQSKKQEEELSSSNSNKNNNDKNDQFDGNQELLNILSHPASPNMSQTHIIRQKSGSNNFEAENNHLSVEIMDECMNAKPNQKYFQEYSPSIQYINSTKKLIPIRNFKNNPSNFQQMSDYQNQQE